MTDEQLSEFALFSVDYYVVMGDSATIPEEFILETKECWRAGAHKILYSVSLSLVYFNTLGGIPWQRLYPGVCK